MAEKFNRKIVIEDGTEYYGFGFGADCEKVCEIDFNTSVVGYQEIISDPASTGLMLVMTYPLIGNYGITDEDFESKLPTIGALIVRENNESPSNFRYTKKLSELLYENDIPAIEGIDTRALTRAIRDNGTKKAVITSAETSKEDALKAIAAAKIDEAAAKEVSCKKKWYSRTSNHKFNIVAIDCGIKRSIMKSLNHRGCNITVVPFNTSANEIIAMNPDGIYVSSGPGNPASMTETVETIKTLKGKYPMFATGLGMDIAAIAYGAKTYKMKFGHRGGNNPVKATETGYVKVVGQNHDYAVDADSVKGTELEITLVNSLDNTVEGIECKKDKLIATQYYPDHSEGPFGTKCMFDRFIDLMEEAK